MARRINWLEVIANYRLEYDFSVWCNKKKRKLSINRLAYSYLKHEFGQSWINEYRSNPIDFEEVRRIARTPWIKVPED